VGTVISSGIWLNVFVGGVPGEHEVKHPRLRHLGGKRYHFHNFHHFVAMGRKATVTYSGYLLTLKHNQDLCCVRPDRKSTGMQQKFSFRAKAHC
jgi:hypothetical protein